MKKYFFVLLVIPAVISLSSCELIMSLLKNSDKDSRNLDSVVSSTSYELNSSNVSDGHHTIEVDVKSNSKVYVVQVNEGVSDLSKSEIKSTLKSESSIYSEEYTNISRLIENEDLIEGPVALPVPDKIRNYKFIKTPEKDSDSKKIRFSSADLFEKGDTYEFYLPSEKNCDPEDYIPKEAICKYISNYAYVFYINDINWLEDDNYGENFFSDDDFKKIGQTFDSLYKAETNLMGSADISSKYSNVISSFGKIIILVSDIFGDSTQKQNSGVFGFFYAGDFDLDNDVSNGCQMIYMDSVLLKNYPDTAYTTLAHEFCHLLNFTNKEINADLSEEAEWFTEMLAMQAEDLMYETVLKDLGISKNTVVKNRIPYYLSKPNLGFTSWNNANTYYNYGNTFAYGAFLARNYGGAQLINEIATNAYLDDEAITKALKAKGYSVTFKDTVKEFAVSSVNQKLSSKAKDVKTLSKRTESTLGSYKYIADKIDFESIKSTNSGEGIYILDNKTTCDIGAKGFSVQYAGEGIKEFDVTIPSVSGLKMYVVIQEIE